MSRDLAARCVDSTCVQPNTPALVFLLVGLTLPVLLMISFMIFATLPQKLSDPPRYDLVFSTSDSNTGLSKLPVSVNFVVRDGKLKAQYVAYKPPGSYGNNWRKLYVYEASTQ